MRVRRPQSLISLWSKNVILKAVTWWYEVKAKTECCVSNDIQTSAHYIHKKMGESGGWIMTTQSQGIKQAGEPQVVFVCADVWVISLNYTWPQFAWRLPFTRLNFCSHPNVKVLVPASTISKCYTELLVVWVLKSIVPTSLLHTALKFRLALWKL